MPSFADSIFLFVLALLLFGPKKLPVLARELGKWMGEFRRASNEFKMQMEDELRASEQAERKEQIAAMEAAAPVPPPPNEPADPVHPHLRYTMPEPEPSLLATTSAVGTDVESVTDPIHVGVQPEPIVSQTADGARPLPIATSGSLQMMPPATGLPTPRNGRSSALAGLIDAIPEIPEIPVAPTNGTHTNGTAAPAESVAHAD